MGVGRAGQEFWLRARVCSMAWRQRAMCPPRVDPSMAGSNVRSSFTIRVAAAK
jgi:hypothetical protein